MSSALKSAPPDPLFFVQNPSGAAPIAELARVALVEPVVTEDGATLPAMLVGTVVGVWGGGEAYEVEFTDPIEALVTVRPHLIRAVEPAV